MPAHLGLVGAFRGGHLRLERVQLRRTHLCHHQRLAVDHVHPALCGDVADTLQAQALDSV
eukprot:COSAG02_NODE_47295_length_342_cov_0.843621_1_plen_59_part_10